MSFNNVTNIKNNALISDKDQVAFNNSLSKIRAGIEAGNKDNVKSELTEILSNMKPMPTNKTSMFVLANTLGVINSGQTVSDVDVGQLKHLIQKYAFHHGVDNKRIDIAWKISGLETGDKTDNQAKRTTKVLKQDLDREMQSGDRVTRREIRQAARNYRNEPTQENFNKLVDLIQKKRNITKEEASIIAEFKTGKTKVDDWSKEDVEDYQKIVQQALDNDLLDKDIADKYLAAINQRLAVIAAAKAAENALAKSQLGLSTENDSVASIQTNIARTVSKSTLASIKEHKSYQIIVDLLKAAKMTMEEFLKSVEKSKDFSKSLEKLVDKAYESYKEESVRALDKKAIPSSELLKVTQLIEGLKKDIVSVQNIIKKAISLAQIKEKNPLIIKFNNFVNVISEFEKTLNQISNNGNSEPEKAISMARNGTFATLVFSLTSQGKKDLKLNIDNIEKNVDEMIKKVEGFLANNDLSNLDIKNEGIVMKDLNNLGKLIDGIKSMMLTATTSKEFSVMENNLSMALGLQDKISKSLGNKEGAIA